MATTFTSTRAAAGFPVAQAQTGGALQVAYGTLEVAANPTDGDIYKLCKIPAGSTIMGGAWYGDRLDTNGSETLDIDIGWAANGGSGTDDSANPDGLGDLGTLTGDVFALGSTSPTTGYIYPFAGILALGDLPTFTKETMIQAECNTTAATFAAGAISVVVYYTTD